MLQGFYDFAVPAASDTDRQEGQDLAVCSTLTLYETLSETDFSHKVGRAGTSYLSQV